MSKYIPYPFYWDDVPIDLSFIYKNEKPAGKHGFLKVVGDHFEFEDGTVGKFWGVNFNAGANFPEFDYSEKVARRIAKIGVNIVRFHQLDAEWSTPNIFQFSKGERKGNTLSFDPESIKRLDYLIYCLKKEGIYCYLDMITYRKFKTGDGVENASSLVEAAKPYCNYSENLIKLQKKYAYDLWTHINPYTGLAYKDDPVFVMTCIANETSLFYLDIEIEPYKTEFKALFQEWLLEKKIEFDIDNCDFNGFDDEIVVRFKMELQERFYLRMMEYFREIGVKIPITGTNHTWNIQMRKPQTVTDFCDTHIYWYNWKWDEDDKIFYNKPLHSEADIGVSRHCVSRSLDKPFFISEWDMPWPNEYRAESPILYAAIGALQGWSGFIIHTYTYDTKRDLSILGKEMSSSSVGGKPFREGVFNTWNDPAKFGLFYHSALITRRGDVAISKNNITINVDPYKRGGIPSLKFLTEVHRIGVEFHEGKSSVKKSNGSDNTIADNSTTDVKSDTGELYRSWEKNYGTIDTALTKCVYGLLGKNAPISLDGLTVDSKTDFAVIALSSLTDKPLIGSDNILLTTVGRAKNTDAKFDGEQMLDYGKPPILIEVIEAKITLKTVQSDLKVWAVNAEGFFIGRIPSEYKDGKLMFKLGDMYPSMYYLIQAE